MGKVKGKAVQRIPEVLLLIMVLYFPTPMDVSATVYSSISGTVVAEDTGKRLAGVSVVALPEEGARGEQFNATTDTRGVYVLKDLRHGTYRLGFFKRDSLYLKEDPHLDVVLPKGKNVVNVNHVLKLGGGLSGTVYGADGVTPLIGVGAYALVPKVSPEWIDGSRYRTTDANGKFLLQGLPESDACTVEVSVPGYALFTRTVQIQKGTVSGDVNFIVKADDITGINGSVKSSIDNRPVAKARVDLEDSFGSDAGFARTDEAGNYSIVGVPPGIYDVTAYWPEGGDWVEKTSITVESGKSTRIDLEFNKVAPIHENRFQPLILIAGAQRVWKDPGPWEPKIHFCDKSQEKLIYSSYLEARAIIDFSTCLTESRREKLYEVFSQGLGIECSYGPYGYKGYCTEGNMAYADMSCPGGEINAWKVHVCPYLFVPKVKSCMAAILFHELIHLSGVCSESSTYACQNTCFPECAWINYEYLGFCAKCE